MKKKRDMSKFFQISERDQKLLWLLGAIIIVFLSVYLGTFRIDDKTDQYSAELVTAQKRQRDLADKNQNRQKYIDDTTIYNNKYTSILSSYDNGTSQDASLAFLHNIERITGTWIKSTTFSTVSPIYTFGKNHTAENGTTINNPTDMVGYKTTLTLAYEAEYDQWKSLVTYINNYYSKNTIDTISMSYNEITGVVSGTMTLSTYCITGSGRSFQHPSTDTQFGTKNIFKSSVFKPTALTKADDNGSYILSDYDYYVLLNASTSDMDSCMIGKKDDNDGTSVLSANANEQQEITIHFAGEDGSYTAAYSIGSQTYPAEGLNNGKAFIPGNSLDLLIMSSNKLSATDKSGAKITLVNDSDMNLNVKVCNDDNTDPRVTFAGKTGAVTIYE